MRWGPRAARPSGGSAGSREVPVQGSAVAAPQERGMALMIQRDLVRGPVDAQVPGFGACRAGSRRATPRSDADINAKSGLRVPVLSAQAPVPQVGPADGREFCCAFSAVDFGNRARRVTGKQVCTRVLPCSPFSAGRSSAHESWPCGPGSRWTDREMAGHCVVRGLAPGVG